MNPTSTPGCPETNGLAENCVKDSKHGTRCGLIQSGFHVSWWELAAECFSFHNNIEERSRWKGDPKMSAYERRHFEKCNATLFPFGVLCDFMKTPFPQNEPGPFSPKAVPGLFCGYHLQPGGRWPGDYYVAEYEPFRKDPDMPLHVARHKGYIHRVKEAWLRPGDDLRFPLGERKTAIARLPPDMQPILGEKPPNDEDKDDPRYDPFLPHPSYFNQPNGPPDREFDPDDPDDPACALPPPWKTWVKKITRFLPGFACSRCKST